MSAALVTHTPTTHWLGSIGGAGGAPRPPAPGRRPPPRPAPPPPPAAPPPARREHAGQPPHGEQSLRRVAAAVLGPRPAVAVEDARAVADHIHVAGGAGPHRVDVLPRRQAVDPPQRGRR